MSYWLACLLGLVQGITEFLPISSDGHLVMLQQLLGEKIEGDFNHLSFDIFLHVGTLLVIIAFFWKDIVQACSGLLSRGEPLSRSLALLRVGFIASVPAAIVGLFFKDAVEQTYQSIAIAACGFLITSVCLFLASSYQKRSPTVAISPSSWGLPNNFQAILIGLAQASAILPGVSRSGTTIAVALLLGLSPDSAVRFSFLLAIPAIAGAGLLEVPSLLNTPSEQILPFLAGLATAVFSGWFAVRLLLTVARHAHLRIFAVYTLVLGLMLLAFAR